MPWQSVEEVGAGRRTVLWGGVLPGNSGTVRRPVPTDRVVFGRLGDI